VGVELPIHRSSFNSPATQVEHDVFERGGGGGETSSARNNDDLAGLCQWIARKVPSPGLPPLFRIPLAETPTPRGRITLLGVSLTEIVNSGTRE
jgi:hypothetical protein